MSQQVQTAPVKVEPLSKAEIKSILPAKYGGTVDDNLAKKINDMLVDPELCMNYRDNFVGFAAVLNEGKYKLQSYIDAVKYVSYQFLGNGNKDSYIKTFPDRYHNHLQNGTSEKAISSYIHAYDKSKLVGMIREQAMIPVWINNQPLFQQALQVQANLMTTSSSDKVRSDAADSILKHTKPPEQVKMQVDVRDERQTSAIDELRKATEKLSQAQQKQLTSGAAGIQDIAHSEIIEHEPEE